MILKSLDKNLKHKIRFCQILIVFSWDFISFKKSRKFFKIIIDFFYFYFLFFITMAHIKQNSSKKPTKKPTNYEFSQNKKIANFINNQLEFFFFFFFFFSSKTKYIYDFPKPKSQTSKDLKQITTFTKSTMFDYNIKTVSYHY